MTPDVWRVPTVLGVMACSALLLFAAAVIVSIAIRRARSRAQTTVLIAALGCLVVGEVAAIRGTASRLARSLNVDVTYVDPGPAGYVGVPIFAGFVFLVGDRVLGRRWTGCQALRFYTWVVVFTALNIVNYCSPGWCETIGFPFAWRTWSDAILTPGDGDLVQAAIESAGPVFSVLLDLVISVAVAGALTGVRHPES